MTQIKHIGVNEMSQVNESQTQETVEAIQVQVADAQEQVHTEESPALPVAISDSVELKGEVDPNDPIEIIKAIFIQYGTDFGDYMRTQLDQVDGIYTLTSFGNPTLQFLYHSNPQGENLTDEDKERIKRTVHVSGFPADDAIAVLELVLNMQKRLAVKGFDIAIAGVIAPVQSADGHNVLVSDFDQVIALSARASFLSGRATLKRLEDAQNASKAAEEAVAAQTSSEETLEPEQSPAETSDKEV